MLRLSRATRLIALAAVLAGCGPITITNQQSQTLTKSASAPSDASTSNPVAQQPESVGPSTPLHRFGSTSTNWSGYILDMNNITQIQVTITVPTIRVSNSSTTSIVSAWCGIGGVATPDLIQIGTDTETANGSVESTVWWEKLPATSRQAEHVHPGDSVSFLIQYQGGNVWSFVINDLTSGQQYTRTVHYTSHFKYAEWIVEDPSHSIKTTPGHLFSLAHFSSISMADASAFGGGTTFSLTSANVEQTRMVRGGNTVWVYPGKPSGNGGFTTYETSVVP